MVVVATGGADGTEVYASCPDMDKVKQEITAVRQLKVEASPSAPQPASSAVPAHDGKSASACEIGSTEQGCSGSLLSVATTSMCCVGIERG